MDPEGQSQPEIVAAAWLILYVVLCSLPPGTSRSRIRAIGGESQWAVRGDWGDNGNFVFVTPRRSGVESLVSGFEKEFPDHPSWIPFAFSEVPSEEVLNDSFSPSA